MKKEDFLKTNPKIQIISTPGRCPEEAAGAGAGCWGQTCPRMPVSDPAAAKPPEDFGAFTSPRSENRNLGNILKSGEVMPSPGAGEAARSRRDAAGTAATDAPAGLIRSAPASPRALFRTGR